MKTAVILLVCLLAVASMVECKRNRGGRGGRGRGGGGRGGRNRGVPDGAQTLATWQRTLTSDTASESAFTLPDQADQIYVFSVDKRKLKSQGYKPSKTLFDFSGDSPLVMMKVKKIRGCLVMETPDDLTKDGLTAQLQGLEGQTVEATTPEPVYLVPERLQGTEADMLLARPAVSSMCGRKPIRRVTNIAPLSMEGVRTTLATAVGRQLSISDTSPRGGRGGGRGGRRNGRQGGGGRRRNRGERHQGGMDAMSPAA